MFASVFVIHSQFTFNLQEGKIFKSKMFLLTWITQLVTYFYY